MSTKKTRSKIYQSYMFRTKDPAIDEFRTVVEDHFGERVKSRHLRKIEEYGGPSSSAMAGWFFGTIMRPQNATLEAAGRSLGMRRVWVPNTKKK